MLLKDREFLLDAAGWAAIAVFVGVWDLGLTRRGRKSLSRFVWEALDRPFLGPVTAGGMGLTVWHLIHKPGSWEHVYPLHGKGPHG